MTEFSPQILQELRARMYNPIPEPEPEPEVVEESKPKAVPAKVEHVEPKAKVEPEKEAPHQTVARKAMEVPSKRQGRGRPRRG